MVVVVVCAVVGGQLRLVLVVVCLVVGEFFMECFRRWRVSSFFVRYVIDIG